jgi:AraC-like DNA-binding protein
MTDNPDYEAAVAQGLPVDAMQDVFGSAETLHGPREHVEWLAEGVCRMGPTPTYGGLQVRCLLAPYLRVLLTDFESIPHLRYTMRMDGQLVLAWRLAGEATPVSDPDEPPDPYAYLYYLPPGAGIELDYPGGAWKSVALLATPQALEARWGLGRPLFALLGLDFDNLPQSGPAHRRLLSITPAVLEEIHQAIDLPARPELIRPYTEARVLALLCRTLDCGPRETERLSTKDVERVHRAYETIVQMPARPHTLQSLATGHGLNRNKLARGFREVFGTTVFDVLQRERLKMSCRLLEDGKLQVGEVARAEGYKDATSFSRSFRRHYGVAPREAPGRARGGH